MQNMYVIEGLIVHDVHEWTYTVLEFSPKPKKFRALQILVILRPHASKGIHNLNFATIFCNNMKRIF